MDTTTLKKYSFNFPVGENGLFLERQTMKFEKKKGVEKTQKANLEIMGGW